MRCERCGKPLDKGEAITTADREIICAECLNTNEKTPLEVIKRSRRYGEYLSTERGPRELYRGM